MIKEKLRSLAIKAFGASRPSPDSAKPPVPAPNGTELAVAPGSVVTNPNDGLNYVWIPPGTFVMGYPAGNTKDIAMAELAGEIPAHEVTITKEFWLGQTQVTHPPFATMTSHHPTRFNA